MIKISIRHESAIHLCLLTAAHLILSFSLIAAESVKTASDGQKTTSHPDGYENTSIMKVPLGSTQDYVPGKTLMPSVFHRLPIGSIKPQGWLRHMLELETRGMTGRLKEISPWLKPDSNAWADPQGRGHSGWEELPYWLKGYADLGYVLNDQTVIKEAKFWIESVLVSQDATGWFGPRELQKSLDGKPDMWPHMVMLNVMQSYYEYSQDARILPFMSRYFRWQNQIPEDSFEAGYWPKIRAGDNIESIHWLFRKTGEDWLLLLATKIHKNMAKWSEDVINWHNVNIAQGFRAPAMYYVQTGDEKLLEAAERNYQKVMGIYGQFPGGGFAGDENCRPGFIDPRQGFETCGIVEFMHSFQLLTRISGNPIWSDRCEYITFNSFPASMTPDLKGLHYLTCANQVLLDRQNKAPGIQNGGTMFSYSPFEVYRCCQHNVSHGWPYYAEELWLGTADGGLCASLYSASEVTAKLKSEGQVTIIESTDYPFNEQIKFQISTDKDLKFPLYLRIPGWCLNAAIKINGTPVDKKPSPLSYVKLLRTWKNGDIVELSLPMNISVKTWEKNKNSCSIEYGPLTFSLKIEEQWNRYGKSSDWPEWEVMPLSAWNYGLLLDSKDITGSLTLVRKTGKVDLQPFTPETVPLQINAKARKIEAWQTDRNGLVGLLQPSPAFTDQPLETITLIPMGAARLRVSAFPTVTTDTKGYRWIATPKPKPSPYKPSASHVFENDTVTALCDGLEPSNSNDHSIPRFTWWNHIGTSEWVGYDLPKKQRLSGVAVYWFDDRPSGRCRVPQSWRVMYKDGETWKPVQETNTGGTLVDCFNKMTFKTIETTAMRVEVQLQAQYSAGILELKLIE